jgi:hypothetical protein
VVGVRSARENQRSLGAAKNEREKHVHHSFSESHLEETHEECFQLESLELVVFGQK